MNHVEQQLQEKSVTMATLFIVAVVCVIFDFQITDHLIVGTESFGIVALQRA